MEGETKARWLDLCVEATICEDPQRLVQLTADIMTILHEEQRRLEVAHPHRLRH
jgi:hypothetical protein